MRRTLFILVVAVAACGGKQKSTTPPPPLPEAKAEPAPEPKPADSKPEAKPAEPKAPAGPVEATVPAPEMQVKLINAGKGKKEKLQLKPNAGAKQHVEMALDFGEKQSAPAELGGDTENSVPTVVLGGDAEVKSVDNGKAAYVVTVSETDVRDPSSKLPAELVDKFKHAVSSLNGLTIAGTIDPNGTASEVKLRVEKPAVETEAALELVRVALPQWPLLPNEPIGVGAKWQVTHTTKVIDKVQVTQTTDYELTAHKGNTWTVKGTTKVTGGDQEIQGAKLSKIGGTGTVEIAMVDGALYPTMKSNTDTGFSVSASVPDPQTKTEKTVTMTIALKQGAQVTPK